MAKQSLRENRDMPALPCLGYSYSAAGGITADPCIYDGLSKRELFAAMAMQGLLANSMDVTPEIFAQSSVRLADALLAELEKKEK